MGPTLKNLQSVNQFVEDNLQQSASLCKFILPFSPNHGSHSDGDADQVSGKSYALMTINRISIGKMALEFLHPFNFNTNLLADIW